MEQIKTSPIFLGFSSQKGGVGKSTLAEMVSSILYYERNIRLFVVESDLSQDSFYKLREREKACIESDPQLSQQMKQHFSSLKRTAYRILKADSKEAIEKATSISVNIRLRISIWSSSTFLVIPAQVPFCSYRWRWTIFFHL